MKIRFTICCLLSFAFRGYGQDTIPTSAGERMNSLQVLKGMKDSSLVKNVPFRNIGPTIMGGRVVDVAVNPEKPEEFYVAYASGGLWHSINNGQSFVPVFDHEAAITLGAIAVNWQSHTIWAGTGESNSSRSSYAGTGVYVSSDSGKTWEHRGLEDSHHIGRIVLDPSSPLTAWVAVTGHLYSPNSERGVYKTTDGGKTWKKVLYLDDNTGAIDLALDPVHTNILYATMWHRE
ncbi:MAG: glycosyl hydrolase, partial [Bacteroidia bacterium]|nr:glycosyl hydrolase [Bacteroidia bacterium]